MISKPNGQGRKRLNLGNAFYNPAYAAFMPVKMVRTELQVFQHARIAQSIWLHALQIQEFGNTRVV